MTKTNFYRDFDFSYAAKFIKDALKEDIGSGDVTTNLLIPPAKQSDANLLLKENAVIAGLKLFKMVFEIVDPSIKIKLLEQEGKYLKKGSIIASIHGKTRSILKSERVSLNIIQRMSGIATSVFDMKKRLGKSSAKIVDTRKTTPNFRIFEKLAVRIGGGDNHRFGLFDMILIKDNHIAANGGIENTLRKLNEKNVNIRELKKEIEVKNTDEFLKVLEFGKGIVDIVMLDNFSFQEIREVIQLNRNTFKIEVSGGVNSDNISNYSNLSGIDIISVGALTHSVKSVDLALDFIS